jgi:hypothetical protein
MAGVLDHFKQEEEEKQARHLLAETWERVQA